MPVSAGLQKYFDGKRKWDYTKAKLDAISQQIDPAFALSFSNFHDRILGIIGENPNESDIVAEELSELQEKIKDVNAKNELQKAATILKNS